MDINNRYQLGGLGAYLGSHVIQWDQLQVTYHIHLLERVECAEAFLSHDKGVSYNDSDRQHHRCACYHDTRGNLFTITVYLDVENVDLVYQPLI